MAARVQPLLPSRTPKKKRNKVWVAWTLQQKIQCASQLARHGYGTLRTRYPVCPPYSTIRGWLKLLDEDAVFRVPGRPCFLNAEEEKILMESLIQMRREGTIVDNEVMLLVGMEVLKFKRGAHCDVHLSVGWAKSFRRRHGIKKLNKGSTDRPPLSIEQKNLVNKWKEEYESIALEPHNWGVEVPIAWDAGVPIGMHAFVIVIPCSFPSPAELQLCADETPLPYIPRTKGTYRLPDGTSRTFIFGL